MLVLSRKRDQQILIGQNIKVTILRVQGRIVKVGVEAPENIAVFRSELLGRPSPSAVSSQRSAISDQPSAVGCQKADSG
jgi:carbon storage regulator